MLIQLTPPALAVIGEVVKFSERLQWLGQDKSLATDVFPWTDWQSSRSLSAAEIPPDSSGH
jgi:hypothetical protein